jgi:hypothetical protein
VRGASIACVQELHQELQVHLGFRRCAAERVVRERTA